MNEAKLRQRSLLENAESKPLPKDIEAKLVELLVQLLVAAIPAINGERRDEQDHA